MTVLEQAIMHGAAAGKLRAYVRKNGSGLAGLEKLAERHSSMAHGLLGTVAAERAISATPRPR